MNDTGRPRILLVEDSPTQALILSHAMEAQGWEVEVAHDADAALATLDGRLPDVVVADINLPGMQGDDLCRRIRMTVRARTVPILLLTAEDRHDAELSALEAGADAFVSKSMPQQVVILRVRGLLRHAPTGAYPTDFGGAQPLRSARLLMVSADPSLLERSRADLTVDGYQVDIAHSAEQGLERFRSVAADCVLIDHAPPALRGHDLCADIRATVSDDGAIVIVLTAGDPSLDERARGFEAGADEVMDRSREARLLNARVQALLRRRFLRRENEGLLATLAAREQAAARERAAREAAEARAALAEQLAATNQKLQETQASLIHAERMASLGRMTAGIAHEINNPLGSVLNFLYAARERVSRLRALGDRLDPEARTLAGKVLTTLDHAQGELERARDIVGGLRSFSDLERAEFRDVDVRESLASALVLLGDRVPPGVRIASRLDGVRRLRCHAAAFNQLLLILMDNAVQAVGSEGTVTVETGDDAGDFVLRVRDTGPGIPDDIMGRIFDPFFTTREVGSGTGLGLAIAHRVATLHGGTLSARNVDGGGAEFALRVPRDRPPDEGAG